VLLSIGCVAVVGVVAGLPIAPTARRDPAAVGPYPGDFGRRAWYGVDARASAGHMQFYYENLYVSSFYAFLGARRSRR